MLGHSLVPTLLAHGHEVVATDIDLRAARPWGQYGPTLGELDVRSRRAVQEAFVDVRPELVCHLAAETDLEVCETDPDHAWLTNAIGTKYVALACRTVGVPLAYVSTAGVFDGHKEEPYDEFDAPNPINVYGASKYYGERIVADLVEAHWIVRAGWMVGGGSKDHKFVARIVRQLDEGRTTIHAVGDKLGTPTYAPDFSRCFATLIAGDLFGTYHMACSGSGTRYDVAARILEVLGRDDVDLVEVDSEFFKEEFFAPRPRSEIMRNRVLDLQGMNTMRPWEVALEEYLQRYFADPQLIPGRVLERA